MNRLDKRDRATLETLQREINERAEALAAGIEGFNEALQTAWAEHVDEALAAYNEKLEDVRAFVADSRENMDVHFDDKSEKWQEGGHGVNYADWKEKWDVDLFLPLDIDCPDPLDDQELNDAEKLADLPVEPDGE